MELIKKMNTVVELRTGIVGLTNALLGTMLAFYINRELDIILAILICLSCFLFNLVTNVASEISGYINNEDTEEYQTQHQGSEGLARGDINLKEALFTLFIVTVLAVCSGLAAVVISRNIMILVIGIIGFFAALLYSLTKFSYNKLPVGEFVSGLMLGYLTCLSAIILQCVDLSLGIYLFCLVPFFHTSYLMAANNITDYEKDFNNRKTLAHVLGNELFIKLISIFLFLELIIISYAFYILGFNIYLIIIPNILILYFGFYRWYLPFYKARSGKLESKVWGPRPLILMKNFNFYMSIVFLVGGLL